MRRIISKLITLTLIIITFSSCEDKRFQTYTANVPVYLSYEDLRKSIEKQGPEEIKQAGKISFYKDYIFINEFMKGVHIIDISDPSSPDQLCYIPVPGNIEMAVKDDILYLDSYTDLLLIDISDPANPIEKDRIEDMLEYTLPPYDTDYPVAEVKKDEGVVSGWEVKEYTQEINVTPYPYPLYDSWKEFDLSSSVRPNSGGGGGSTYSVGGSMARFLTYDKYIYMLQSTNKLKVIDISSPDNPLEKYDQYVGWGLETMFIYQGYLYLGATQGLYILSLQNPEKPFTKSVYNHISSCDPVVVSGNLAYVTLRSGNICGGTADLLEVIDISDKYNPKRIASYGMNEPYGLGISGSTLFVCQGDNGLVVYDVADPYHIDNHKIAEFTDIKSTDVIPIDSTLFTIGEGGFYIYDYSDINDINQIGTIPIASGDK